MKQNLKYIYVWLTLVTILFTGCPAEPSYNYNTDSANTYDGSDGPTTYEPSNPPPQQKQFIVDKPFHVRQDSYTWFEFSTDGNQGIYGDFSVEGGRNDIECYVLDETGFINFKNKNDFRSYFRSGNVTVEKLSGRFPQGNYYLVFKNPAWFDNKTVTANIWLE